MPGAGDHLSLLLFGERSIIAELSGLFPPEHFTLFCSINNQDETLQLPENCQPAPETVQGIKLAFELTNIDIEAKKDNLLKIESLLPTSTPILSSSITTTITTQGTWLRFPERLVGFCAFPTILSHSLIEICGSITTDTSYISVVREFFMSMNKETSIVQDRTGMVAPRVISMIINEAFFALMEEIATPNDIDLAMKLGTNYPLGPVEWGEKIGFQQIVSVLDAIHMDTGEERYRVAPLLRQISQTRR